MKRLTFPNQFPHTHPPVQDVNEILEEQALVEIYQLLSHSTQTPSEA